MLATFLFFRVWRSDTFSSLSPWMEEDAEIRSYPNSPWPDWGTFIKGFEAELKPPPEASFTLWPELIPEMQNEIVKWTDPWSKIMLSQTCRSHRALWQLRCLPFHRERKVEKLLGRYGTFRLLVIFLWEKRNEKFTRSVQRVGLALMSRVVENNRSEGDWIIFKFLLNMIRSYADFFNKSIEEDITADILEALAKGASPATFNWFWPRVIEENFTDENFSNLVVVFYGNAVRHGNQPLLEHLKTTSQMHDLIRSRMSFVGYLRFGLLSNFLQSKPKYWTDIRSLFSVSLGWYEAITLSRDNDLPEDYDYLLSDFIRNTIGERRKTLNNVGYNVIFHLNQLLPYLGSSMKERIWSDDILRLKFLDVARSHEGLDVFTLLHDMGVPRMLDELAPYTIIRLATLVTKNANPPCLTWFLHTGKLYDLARHYNPYQIGSEVAAMMKTPYFMQDDFKNLKAFRQWIIDHPVTHSDRVLAMFESAVAFNRDLNHPKLWNTLTDFGDSTLSFDSLALFQVQSLSLH